MLRPWKEFVSQKALSLLCCEEREMLEDQEYKALIKGDFNEARTREGFLYIKFMVIADIRVQ